MSGRFTIQCKFSSELHKQLKLEDYLSILNKVSKDIKDDMVMKKANTQRVNLIYKVLFNQCINSGENKIEIVKKWSESNKLSQ